MTLGTLIKYLFGSREAILAVARCPQALWIGLVFVIAAGFAREYDGEDLLAEPWHLLIPLGASIASSAILYLLIRHVAWCRSANEPELFRGYLTFLSLYWMTGPLALLYAIPFERFLSAGDATRANLWLLGLVALWRVLLITRVVSVLYQAWFLSVLMVVMLFADSLAVAILAMTPLPIVGIMGGIRLSESEQVLRSVGLAIQVLGVLTWPIWFVATWLVAGLPVLFERQLRSPWSYTPSQDKRSRSVGLPLWITSFASVALWMLILPFTQPAQRLRGHVERDLRAGRLEEALATMSAHEPSDFPPHWDPPPRLAYREQTPDIVALKQALSTSNAKPWVRKVFSDKFANSLRGEDDYRGIWSDLSADEVEERIAIIEQSPDRQGIVRDIHVAMELRLGEGDLPAELQTRLRNLLVESGIQPRGLAGNETND